MQTMTLIPGQPEWHAHRAQHRNASDAPAMLGCSPYTTRAQLLQRLHTGLAVDVDPATQRRFDDGHRFEALARPLAEKIIGDDLAPIVGVLEGTKLSASFDGLTLLGDTVFEHKTLNDDLRGCMGESCIGRDLPKHYRVQMEQQLLVSGAERALFMATKWDGDTLVEARHCWYTFDLVLRAEIVTGWRQFEQDLADYTPPAATAAVVAAPVQALPAVSVKVTGSITVVDNFAKFEVALRDFLEHRLIREPKTDQDFADLDVQIKAMLGAEAALDAAEVQMLAQIDAVDTAAKAKAMLSKLVRDNRLMAQKLLTGEKERRRGEIVAGGIAALREYVAGRNALLGKPYMPTISADFAGCIKGKSSLAKMEDAVATELARAKIAASEVFDRIQANLGIIHELAADFPALIPDRDQLVLKAPEDCRAMLSSRIADHQAREAKRLEEQRERIRAEEVARIQREQEAAARAATPPPTAAPAPVAAAPSPTASTVVPMQRPTTPPSMAAAMPATLTIGAINEHLGFTVTEAFIKRMGIDPAAVDKGKPRYTAGQLLVLCDSMVAHIRTVAHQQQAA